MRILSVLAMLLSVPVAAQTPGTFNFTAQHEGRATDHVAGTWSGRLSQPDGGVIAIRLERVARSSKLHALVFVSHDEMSRSFGADVAGHMTEAGTAQLAGKVNIGPSSGAMVNVSLELCTSTGGCRGTVRFVRVDDPHIPASVMQYPPEETP